MQAFGFGYSQVQEKYNVLLRKRKKRERKETAIKFIDHMSITIVEDIGINSFAHNCRNKIRHSGNKEHK